MVPIPVTHSAESITYVVDVVGATAFKIRFMAVVERENYAYQLFGNDDDGDEDDAMRDDGGWHTRGNSIALLTNRRQLAVSISIGYE